MKRTPIRAKSARQARIDRLRAKIRREFTDEDPMCRRCRVRPGAHLHERLMRSQGGSAVDKSIMTWICEQCHDWCHRNPREARDTGWLTFRKDLGGAA